MIPGEGVEAPKVVVRRQLCDVPAALLAKSILDSAEIECFLAHVNTIRMDWLWSNALGAVKLLVRESDMEAAEELLDQKRVEGFDVEGMGHFIQPRCPHCQSLDVSFKGLNKHLAYGSIAFGCVLPRGSHRLSLRFLRSNVGRPQRSDTDNAGETCGVISASTRPGTGDG